MKINVKEEYSFLITCFSLRSLRLCVMKFKKDPLKLPTRMFMRLSL